MIAFLMANVLPFIAYKSCDIGSTITKAGICGQYCKQRPGSTARKKTGPLPCLESSGRSGETIQDQHRNGRTQKRF